MNAVVRGRCPVELLLQCEINRAGGRTAGFMLGVYLMLNSLQRESMRCPGYCSTPVATHSRRYRELMLRAKQSQFEQQTMSNSSF